MLKVLLTILLVLAALAVGLLVLFAALHAVTGVLWDIIMGNKRE